MRPESGQRLHQVGRLVLCYTLWFVTAALGIVDLLAARTLLLEVYHALDISFWARGAIENFGVLIFAIVWVILIYICESYYRAAAATSLRQLVRRFVWVTTFQLAFLAIAYLLPLVFIA